MSPLGLIIFLAASDICYVLTRDIPIKNAKALNIVLRDLPPNYSCECKTSDQCEPSIFILRVVCPATQGCCLNNETNNPNVDVGPASDPDTILPPIAVHIDRTPPNHSCHCEKYVDCNSKIYVKNVACEGHNACCLHVGQELPVIDYPEIYRRIFGIGEYVHIHLLK